MRNLSRLYCRRRLDEKKKQDAKKPRRALIVIGKLFTDVEYTYPYYRLKEEGFVVDVATPKQESVLGMLGTKTTPNKSIDAVWVDDYELLVLPGGARAMEYLRQEPVLIQLVANFDAKGKIIASICHGSQLLISAKIIKGRHISGYYSIKDDINNAGAFYSDDPVVIDRNIISSPHYNYLGEWMKAVIKKLKEMPR